MGDFRRKPYCDYGTPECNSYQDFRISKIIVHKDFRMDKEYALFNDIALIRLDRNIGFKGPLQPICLPSKGSKLDVNTQLIVSGWGEMGREMTMHDSKQAVELRLYDKKHCVNKHHTMMCAGNRGKTTCKGDSGGPLMHQFARNRMLLVGIVSQGYYCGNVFNPVTFTNVEKFLDWIQNNIQNNLE